MADEELELRREVARAERARAFIEDPLLVDAFATLRQFYERQWTESGVGEGVLREQTWHRLRALAEVQVALRRVLEDGEMARDRLDDLRAGITNP